MDSKQDKMIQDLMHFYHTKCAKDAQNIRNAIKEGRAASMAKLLFSNVQSNPKDFIHGVRFIYFSSYCLNHNNGIPMIEVLNDWIDNDKKEKVINAVKSQKTLFDFLIDKGVDIAKLTDYVAEKETIEYAIDEDKKSTGVLKRILDRKQAPQKDTYDMNNAKPEPEKYEKPTKIMSNNVGSIGKALNSILFNYRESGKQSESYIKYYKQIDQPTHIKTIGTKEIIPFNNYFGAYMNHLNKPFLKWNGFYISPYKAKELNLLINENRIVLNGKFVKEINEIAAHITAYREGFIEGYKRFDYDEIEDPSSVYKSNNLSNEKILTYVNEHELNTVGNFSFLFHALDRYDDTYTKDKYLIPKIDKLPISTEICHKNQDKGICSERMLHNEQVKLLAEGNKLCQACTLMVMPEPQKWKMKGFKGGKLYRAWFIILSNYKLFDEYLSEPALANTEGKNKILPQTLNEIFENTSKYKVVMEILVSKQLVQPNTYIWKDKKAGYKGLICAILKDIATKNYLKLDISMSWELCKTVAQNTFKVEIKGNKTYFNATLSKQYENLIPYSSTLK